MDLENVCGKDGGAKYFYEQAKHPLKIPWSAEHRVQGGFISVGSFANPPRSWTTNTRWLNP